MEFLKYQHVERLGTDETEGILDGECYIFPKIDGTNSSLWIDNGILKCGKRTREILGGDDENAGFYEWAQKQENIKQFFNDYPHLRLFGEWMIPHSLTTYEYTAWENFYVFDVVDSYGTYTHYDFYSVILKKYKIKYIPPICKVNNPIEETLFKSLEKNKYLIKDGCGVGEGIVIKNYLYRNRSGKQTWAKIVRNEFIEQNKEAFGIPLIKTEKVIEEEIVLKYCSNSLIDKEYYKIVNEFGWDKKHIPRLFNIVYKCIITEDMWNILKKYNNPQINFKRLIRFINIRIKTVKPELF